MAPYKKIFFVQRQQKIYMFHRNRPQVIYIKINEINILISVIFIFLFDKFQSGALKQAVSFIILFLILFLFIVFVFMVILSFCAGCAVY
jgi:hypothetical protein